MSEMEGVLEFWFGAGPAADVETARARTRRWFMGGPELDREIRQRFQPLVERALAGQLDGWASTPRGRLALVLLLDQFTRNIWREEPRCYAGDARAQQLALEGLDAGDDAQLDREQRLFLRMPLTHAESLPLQERSVRESERLVESAPEALRPVYAMGLEQARKYREVIARFGRFPHRNKVLGRETTPEERAFLETWTQAPSGMRR